MATEAELKKIGIKVIEDDAFHDAFKADPAKAAATMGITFTPEQLDEVKKKKRSAGKRRFARIKDDGIPLHLILGHRYNLRAL
jgi:hypothetical protein